MPELYRTVRSLYGKVKTDLSLGEILKLLPVSLRIREENLTMLTLPGEATRTRKTEGAWYYVLHRRAAYEIVAEYLNLIKHFHVTFGNRIMKQIRTYIPVYISCGGDELTALDDILAKKIIRKLETQNPIYLRGAAEGLIAFLDALFGTDKMPLCKEYIRRLERNA